jgi:hypothetical protein
MSTAVVAAMAVAAVQRRLTTVAMVGTAAMVRASATLGDAHRRLLAGCERTNERSG